MDQFPEIERLSGSETSHHVADLIDQLPFAVHHRGIGIGGECSDGLANGTGHQSVVRVEPGHDLALRQSHAFVDRVRLAEIALANEMDPIRKLLQNLPASVPQTST